MKSPRQLDKEFNEELTGKRLLKRNAWVAPEHFKEAIEMERDEKGNLVVDLTPPAWRKERQKYDYSLGYPIPIEMSPQMNVEFKYSFWTA